MSKINLQQTRIDQFYKVISNRSTGCGYKLSNTTEFSPKKGGRRKFHTSARKSKMSSVVESEVKIIDEIKSIRNKNLENSKQKRRTSIDINNSSKKQKVNDISNSNSLSTQLPLEVQSPNKSDSQSMQLQKTLQINLNLSPVNSFNSCQSPVKTKSFNHTDSPKKSPRKSPMSSPQKSRFSPRKLFFANRVHNDVLLEAIENLNLLRQGSINNNDFDLESIYEKQEFSYFYSEDSCPNVERMELKDIVYPNEKHADHMLMIVGDVFCNPINCSYFFKEELNLIFSLFTLSPEAQMLFVRLLKRKLGWHRTCSIKYPEIHENLNPFFVELVKHKFCSSDLESTHISVLLNMLNVEEIKNVCQKLKINHKGNKSLYIDRLIEYGKNSKSFFLGAKSPKSILRSTVYSVLQMCVCLPEDIINLFDRVINLLHPVQDPTETIADLFLMLTNVHKGEVIYPPGNRKEKFPIFENRSNLSGFVESKNAYKDILAAIERKEWDLVKKLGRLALEKLTKVENKNKKSSLPLHIRKFIPEFSWLKVLSKSIDAFKKSPDTIPEAVEILNTLINYENISLSSKGRYYSELALIEMHHRKDLEKSASLTIHALNQQTLTDVDVSDLQERLKKLMRRKNGLSNETRELIQQTQKSLVTKGLVFQPTSTKTITANMANRTENQGKSTWCIEVNGNQKYYGCVELVALKHYTSIEDFHEGLHCEGSLPITLFTVFFWDELYTIFVPGAFVSAYQEAPLDLFTIDFFKNRKNEIEKKMKFVKALDIDTFSDWMYDQYTNYIQYRSLMPNTLFKNEQQFKDVVTCLGINGITGICERMVSNYRLWRSGFPDLIVWNILLVKCKIVEVKGPGDSLSEKQKLWLQYLEQLGINVEVCLVEAVTRSSK